MALSENKQRMLRGELYHAFTPELISARRRCERACSLFNSAGDVSRRKRLMLWKDVIDDHTPLPLEVDTPEADEELLAAEPWIQAPVHMDYGTNVRVEPGVFINFNCTFLDTCLITIGARTLVGPNVSFFSGTHPEDPILRDGTNGPELGNEIVVGQDAWIGGNAIILPGVTIGRGAVVGAGSVVTKDVPDFWIAAGNPARLLRKVKTAMDPESPESLLLAQTRDVEKAMGAASRQMEQKHADYNDDEQGW